MRFLIAAVGAAFVAMLTAPVASAETGPPYIDYVEWAKWGDLSSLRVYPTESGRLAAGQLGTIALADEAWAEVLRLSPDADIVGMKPQFICHWQFAEFAEPGKVSWNIEPWRPEVDHTAMVDAGCNPGGTEEPF